MADAPIVSLADLTVTYAGSERPALSGIDLDIAPGECVGVIGLNGAGKTTLGLCLNGVIPQLLPATVTGRALVAGRDPTNTPVREMARSVGIVFDNPEYQFSQATVAEEVAFGLENLGVVRESMPARIAVALEAVGLAGLEERSPFALSGGQQQRLAIASVLVMEPAILVMDEPTSNLDPVGTAEVFDIVRRLNRDAGMTVLDRRARRRGAGGPCRSHRRARRGPRRSPGTHASGTGSGRGARCAWASTARGDRAGARPRAR